MYQKQLQMGIDDFVFPYGTLNKENDWVKLSEMIPWDKVEDIYAKQFVNNGHPAHPARRALGGLIIKQRLKCSDEWVIKQVEENPYLQYFLGEKEYSYKCPFGASTMVEFRKRFSEKEISAIMEMIIPHEKKEDKEEENLPENHGKLLLDATCCPSDIAYPQDLNLCNQAREKTEKIIDELCFKEKVKKPRMRRKQARKEYLKISKNKNRSRKTVRKAVRKQLNYIAKNMGYIAEISDNGEKLSEKHKKILETITMFYNQQRIMNETNTHAIANRIVSLAQPWVRPIVRGKAKAKTEFGAKLHISLVNGYARIERLDFEAYNECEDFFLAVERYRDFYGYYPQRVLADKIYRNRKTIAFCKEHGIFMSGPALGRPPKNDIRTKEMKQQEYQDICHRNAVEGQFGTGKTAYALGRIAARLENTTCTVIAVALLCMNLCKRLRDLLFFFLKTRFSLSFLWVLQSHGLQSTPYIHIFQPFLSSFSHIIEALDRRVVIEHLLWKD